MRHDETIYEHTDEDHDRIAIHHWESSTYGPTLLVRAYDHEDPNTDEEATANIRLHPADARDLNRALTTWLAQNTDDEPMTVGDARYLNERIAKLTSANRRLSDRVDELTAENRDLTERASKEAADNLRLRDHARVVHESHEALRDENTRLEMENKTLTDALHALGTTPATKTPTPTPAPIDIRREALRLAVQLCAPGVHQDTAIDAARDFEAYLRGEQVKPAPPQTTNGCPYCTNSTNPDLADHVRNVHPDQFIKWMDNQ